MKNDSLKFKINKENSIFYFALSFLFLRFDFSIFLFSAPHT
jgi:hypothetical protein